MVERNGIVVFPLIFYDGERETIVGHIGVHPSMDFKILQSKVSQVIGISYNNITIYFVDGKKSKLSPERRKILITGRVNFSLIARERDCFFLVVLKRSRRHRQRRSTVHEDFEFGGAEKMMLLRRNNHDLAFPDFNNNSYDDRFRDLRMQRENYLNMVSNPAYGYGSSLESVGLGSDPFPKLEEIYAIPERSGSRVMCLECANVKKGEPAAFHCCVYDPVVPGFFRSPAGPIRRPVKHCGEGSFLGL